MFNNLAEPLWSRSGVPMGETPVEYRSLLGSDPEIRIAVVDFKCRQKVDFVNRWAQIQADVQQDYIDQHKTELDRMLAQIEQFEP
jgi:hypothetical protein